MRLSVLLLLVTLTACGYRFGDQGVLCHYRTIEVPFVCGDQGGRLTEALVLELARTGAIAYRSQGADLVLCAAVIDCGRENIGFQYDRNNQGELTDRIVANEGRLFLIVEVTLKDRWGYCLIGPTRFTAQADYDFNPLSTDTELAPFSLGQFTEIDQAEEVALSPLYRDIAYKIIDYLRTYW
ncbi:MAG: LPS assembly lipoprotein LptE [Parachlamydiales bacterium]